jgi:hypothetical protein
VRELYAHRSNWEDVQNQHTPTPIGNPRHNPRPLHPPLLPQSCGTFFPPPHDFRHRRPTPAPHDRTVQPARHLEPVRLHHAVDTVLHGAAGRLYAGQEGRDIWGRRCVSFDDTLFSLFNLAISCFKLMTLGLDCFRYGAVLVVYVVYQPQQ